MTQGKNVGFIGLGAMGRPMAQQLVNHKVKLRVYDPLPEACEPFARQGVVVAGTPAELASWSNVLICMLPHPSVLGDVLFGDQGVNETVRADTIVIDMATDGPTPVIECARRLKERSVEMIDVPCGKGPWAAEKGDLMLLMGGDREICRQVEPILRCMGSELLYCGPLGSGQVIKITNNIVSCTNIATIVEAYNVAHELGADLDVLERVMGSTAADSWQVKNSFKNARKGDFRLGFKARLALKDLQIARGLAREKGLRTGITSGAIEWYEEAVASGYGDLDMGALLLTVEPEKAPAELKAENVTT